ncbi:MAG TPA: hypothetical protein VFI45_12155 [Candidatus Acidoferrum sp.]|nr:hypothetical protein [Candidatus Acidoferrum sp.]
MAFKLWGMEAGAHTSSRLVGEYRFHTKAHIMHTQTRGLVPSSRWKTPLLVLLVVVATFGMGVLLIHGVHRVDPNHVKFTIAKNLNRGSDKASVLRFLDSQDIRHSDYLPEYHRIYAEIDRSTIGLIRAHIHMEFNFDNDGNLVNYEVKELFDSL